MDAERAMLRRAAATGAWATSADWALRRAFDAVGGIPAEQERRELLRLLQEALDGTASPGLKAASAASAYDLLRLLPAEGAGHLRACQALRDAVILCCIFSAGTHADRARFDLACNAAFRRQVLTSPPPAQRGSQDSLYAQLHHSYQQLLRHVPGRFPSNFQRHGRRRPRRERGAPAARRRPEAEELEDESEASAQAAAESQSEAEAWAPAAAEAQTPRSSAPGSAGGASSAAPGAGPPGRGAAGPLRVPADLGAPEDWRGRVGDLLDAIADPHAKAEVVLGSVERLGCRLKEVEASCYFSEPGRQLCGHLLRELSAVVRRFPREPPLHAECRDVLLAVCRWRGDVFGLQAVGVSQERARPVPLCPRTQRSVKDAVATAARASSEEASEEFTRLLVRTQPAAFVLEHADAEGPEVLLDEAKHGLSWCFENMEVPEFWECSRAFLGEVMQHQEREEFLAMHNWVQGGHADSWDHMQERFVVIGLLFGTRTQIIDPLPRLQDAQMISAALRALTLLDNIRPFDKHTNTELVRKIQELGGKDNRELWVGKDLSEAWTQCEAEYMWVLGRLLQGSSWTNAVYPHAVVDWAVQEACGIIEHATTVSAGTAVHAALWCLAQMFLHETSDLGNWGQLVRGACHLALRCAPRFEPKTASEVADLARSLESLCP